MKRRASMLSLAWIGAMLAGLVWGGLHVSFRTMSETAAALIWPETTWIPVALYVTALVVLNELGAFPIAAFSGFALERRYGLSTEPWSEWLLDQGKAVVLTAAVSGAATSVVYGCMQVWPESWWLPAAAVVSLLIVGVAHLAPVALLPLFYEVKALNRPPLCDRLMTLARRANTSVLGVYQWGLGQKTRKANAALTGVGASRRILVSDTMLDAYSDDEIEVVLAHELAHHVHGDIWRGLLLESALIGCAFFAASQVLERTALVAGLRSPTDLAGLPIVLFVFGAVTVVTLPLVRAISRARERRADRAALELTRNPRAFISAMRRLSAQNLSEDRPSRLVQWLFHSHPPTRERIAAAEAFDR